MNSERWHSCTEIFHHAVARPPPERAAILKRRCHGDAALRRRVEALLKYHDASGDFITEPAFAGALEFLVADPDTLIGQQLGSYRLDAVAGVGGMGVVYLAHDERLGRKVALKLLPPALTSNMAELERLRSEARTVSALNHPNIVTVHEMGQVDSTFYVATEFVEGATLRERMSQGSIPPGEAMEIAIQVASALEVAHRAGIVHRDIKPENIILRPDGYVKVLDFGIAKVTPQGSLALGQREAMQQKVLGTARYVSPEQARGETVDGRTDFWSLGVVLYEMLAGRAPFAGATSKEVIAAVLLIDPPPLQKRAPKAPPALQSVIARCLQKNPAKRYQTAIEMLSALRALQKAMAENRPNQSARWLVLAASAALLLGAALLSSRRGSQPNPAAVPEKSIAVLPFENLSPDPDNALLTADLHDGVVTSLAKIKDLKVIARDSDTGAPNNEYFSDGLSEELISALAQIKTLKVIGRTSSFHFKKTKEKSKVIGAALGVDYLLEGSVRKSAGRARIAVNLVRAADGVNAWSQIFDRSLPDIFVVQAEIAQSVAGALKVALLGDADKNPDAPSNQNVDAYTAYLQGRYYEKRYTAADLRKAVGFYDAAIQSDPHYALAYSALSKSWWALGDITGGDVAEANRKARAAAERAVSEDPNLAEGHAALGQILVSVDQNAKGAEAEFRRAAALAPASAEPKIGLSTILSNFGQIEEAVDLLQQAVRIDPLSTNSHFDLARLLTSLGRYKEAAESARKAIALQPGGAGTWEMLALVEAKRGDGEAALKAAAQESDPDWRAYALALAQQARGDRLAADAALDALIAGHSDDMSFQIATVYAFRRDADKTFEWLDRAREKRDPGVMAIIDNPFTRELQSDPRFSAFCKKVGLPFPPDGRGI